MDFIKQNKLLLILKIHLVMLLQIYPMVLKRNLQTLHSTLVITSVCFEQNYKVDRKKICVFISFFDQKKKKTLKFLMADVPYNIVIIIIILIILY